MKAIKKFNFIVQAESHKILEGKIDNNAAAQITGGRREREDSLSRCDPWQSCDAWNCSPDCICKSNLA